MSRKFRHNKLEENRALLLQISIIITLLIVLAAFNYQSRSKSKFDGDFVEINLQIDTAQIPQGKLKPPLPVKLSKQAEFPGRKEALKNYFMKNLKYPEDAKKQNIQGRIYVKFTVNEYGKITNPKIIRSIYPSLDKEALLLIKNMPDWIPAKKGNLTVKSEQILPVVFIKNSNK